MFQKNVTVMNKTKKKPSSTHGCGRVDIPGIGIYPIISCKRDKDFFFFYISIQNCLKKFGLDRETSSVWDGATLKYVQR